MMYFMKFRHNKLFSAVIDPKKRDAGQKNQKGFSILEVAVVLVILGLLIGSIITPLSAQRESRQRALAEQDLQEIKQALLGFALVNGRLPCPADTNTDGLEDANGSGDCLEANGYVPNVTLGLSGQVTTGNLLADPWNTAYRYSLTGVNSWEYAKNLSIDGTTPDLQVCSSTACTAATTLTSSAVAVVFSMAKFGSPNASSSLETENTDNDTVFVQAGFAESGSNAFDDEIIWLSQNELAYALMQGGRGQ